MKKCLIGLLLVSFLVCGCSIGERKYVCTYNEKLDEYTLNYKTILKYEKENLKETSITMTYDFVSEDLADTYYDAYKEADEDEKYKITKDEKKIIVKMDNTKIGGNDVDTTIKDAVKQLKDLGYTCK